MCRTSISVLWCGLGKRVCKKSPYLKRDYFDTIRLVLNRVAIVNVRVLLLAYMVMYVTV